MMICQVDFTNMYVVLHEAQCEVLKLRVIKN